MRAPGYTDLTEMRHLKRWQMITIGGVSAYLFFNRNDEVIGGYRPLTMLHGYYTIGELAVMLTAVNNLRKRWRRPDSPTDAGTKR